ncbi:tyrosine recombinase XerS (plasmid) [Rossellomorea marisflavi]|jgi:site-specific recombinase XerD|uniref:tyrosine recombinase XerS n=1 Tax=Rossellomorea marisflavi TaxID=189381 RepID=UPI00131890E2|nr:tyrosine recombinase XerS [Rossellomorea marisflavi]QHA38763.1 tyrosine recombinase XerS [Rossellomorea marisflavi]
MAKRERLTRQQRLHKEKLELKLPSLPWYVDQYKDDMFSGNTSPSTLLGYFHDFEKFFQWLITEGIADVSTPKEISLKTLEELKLTEANAFFTHLKYDLELQDDSINRKKSSLKSLFKYLTERTEDEEGECYFYRNVMAKVKMHKVKEDLDVRADRISTKILHGEEMLDFVAFIENDYVSSIDKQKLKKAYFKRDKERDLAIITLFLASGIRVSELANLTLNAVNLKKRKLNVLRKGSKESTVFFREFAVPYLEKYRDLRETRYKALQDEKYYFLTKYRGSAQPLSVRSIQELIAKYTEAYRDERLYPHKMRHSFATEYAKHNTVYDLMRQLGHSSTDTSSLYVNSSEDEARNAIDKLEK